MTKKICISVPEWVFDAYLLKSSNRSGFILEMIIKGFEITDENMPEIKIKIQTLIIENSGLKEELKRIKFELEGWKARKGKSIMSDNDRMSKAIKNAGLMSLRRKE